MFKKKRKKKRKKKIKTKINIKALKEIQNHKPKPKKIIVATKNQPLEKIKEAIKHNLFYIGENKVQEAEKKFLNKKERTKIELHLIGHLQKNKAKKAVKLFDVIQTADSKKIIKKINIEAEKIKKTQQIYIQINIGKDINKKGIKEEEIKDICDYIKKQKNIILKGIMTILPQKTTKQKKKELFTKTKTIQQKIQKTHTPTCKEVSMGMSGDYKEALKCGATQIRIGTKLFGERK